VELATRLSDTSTLLAESQLEVTSLKNREAELRQQLDKLITMDTQSRDELSSVKLRLTGESAVMSLIMLRDFSTVVYIIHLCSKSDLGERAFSKAYTAHLHC